MARVIAGMTMSLHGFVADRNGSVERLYPDFADLQDSLLMNSTNDPTAAVTMGRKTFAKADLNTYLGNDEFQVLIFVLTHRMTRPSRCPRSRAPGRRLMMPHPSVSLDVMSPR